MVARVTQATQTFHLLQSLNLLNKQLRVSVSSLKGIQGQNLRSYHEFKTIVNPSKRSELKT